MHHERDQVMGYTGNLLGGDERDGSGDNQMVSVGLRYLDDSGRSREFASADKIKMSSKDGVHTFSNVPADKKVIVQASKTDAASSIKLLDPDELAAYMGMDANGITGGAFGAMGGFNHTVELCPLQATAPQDHGECASFAYVTTHTVSGLVWKKGVSNSGTDEFEMMDPAFVAGQTVSLTPVEDKNLAGEEESFTTTEKDGRKDKTKGVDPTHAFSFDDVASGAYELGIPDGWRVKMGGKGATAAVGDALSPLDAAVALDITPATATVYGRVDGGDGFPLEGVTVDVNGRTATTAAAGRYIVDDVSAVRGKVFVSADKEGQNAPKPDSTSVEFGENTVSRLDIDLSAVSQTASISGTVRASGTAAPIAGAEVSVTGATVTNLVKGKLLTDAEGTYTAIVEAVALGTTVGVGDQEGHELCASVDRRPSRAREFGHLGHRLHRLRARHDHRCSGRSGRWPAERRGDVSDIDDRRRRGRARHHGRDGPLLAQRAVRRLHRRGLIGQPYLRRPHRVVDRLDRAHGSGRDRGHWPHPGDDGDGQKTSVRRARRIRRRWREFRLTTVP